jgi:hypothetical protein
MRVHAMQHTVTNFRIISPPQPSTDTIHSIYLQLHVCSIHTQYFNDMVGIINFLQFWQVGPSRVAVALDEHFRFLLHEFVGGLAVLHDVEGREGRVVAQRGADIVVISKEGEGEESRGGGGGGGKKHEFLVLRFRVWAQLL